MAAQTKKDATPVAASFTQVTIIKTDEVQGHVYRRGTRPHVDASTLAAMTAQGMIDGSSG